MSELQKSADKPPLFIFIFNLIVAGMILSDFNIKPIILGLEIQVTYCQHYDLSSVYILIYTYAFFPRSWTLRIEYSDPCSLKSHSRLSKLVRFWIRSILLCKKWPESQLSSTLFSTHLTILNHTCLLK